MTSGTASTFQRNKTREGWKLIEDVGETQLFSPDNLELAPFLKKGERHIDGEKLVRRAKRMQVCFGQRQAEYLLKHQKKMPEEWRQYRLFFPGAIWSNQAGGREAPFLGWDGKRWYLDFIWLLNDFGDDTRLLCSRQ